jgi:hypothetical protein
MSKGRFLAFDKGSQVFVMGIYARNLEEAEVIASDLLKRDLDLHPYRKPSGWADNGGLYLTKDSKYGVKYWCKVCGRECLGLGLRNHKSTCVYYGE